MTTYTYDSPAEYHLLETPTCRFLIGAAGCDIVCARHGWDCDHKDDARAWVKSQPRDEFGLLKP